MGRCGRQLADRCPGPGDWIGKRIGFGSKRMGIMEVRNFWGYGSKKMGGTGVIC